MVHAAKELEMIRCEGFEQREGKRTCHSGDHSSSPPRSRGYVRRGYHSQSSRPFYAAIPTYEAGNVGHSSSSSAYTSQGSSSRILDCGGHSGHSGSCHQPTSRTSCFECSDIEHFVRDCPSTRRCGLHQGSQVSTFKAAQPPARGGVQTVKDGSHLGRGGSHSRRGGCRGGSQSEGGCSYCYAFPGRPEVEPLDDVIIGITSIFHRLTTVLFYPDSTYSYVSTHYALSVDILCESLDLLVHVSSPIRDCVVVERVFQLCIVTLIVYNSPANLKSYIW